MELKEALEKFKSHGINTDENIIRYILDNKEELFVPLAKIATSLEQWRDLDDSTYIPICAIHLLSTMGHYRAHLATISATIEYFECAGDWLTEYAVSVLAHMGVDAIWMLSAIVQNNNMDQFIRDTAARALVMIAIEHKEVKSDVITTIQKAIQNETNSMIRAVIVSSLLDLKDPDLYEYLKNLLKTGFISNTFFDINDLDRIYANKDRHIGPPRRNPLDVFTYRSSR